MSALTDEIIAREGLCGAEHPRGLTRCGLPMGHEEAHRGTRGKLRYTWSYAEAPPLGTCALEGGVHASAHARTDDCLRWRRAPTSHEPTLVARARAIADDARKLALELEEARRDTGDLRARLADKEEDRKRAVERLRDVERELERATAHVARLEDACRKGSAACDKRFDGAVLESTNRDLLVAVQAGLIACRDVLTEAAPSARKQIVPAVAEEREACAQVAEDCAHRNPDTCAAIAAAIRARGAKQ